MSKVLNINADQFEKEVLKSSVPVLVDFWAPWCGPCIMMGPILDEVSEKIGSKAKIMKIDVDEKQNTELARKFSIRSIPSMKIFSKGNVVEEYLGTKTKNDLISGIEKYI